MTVRIYELRQDKHVSFRTWLERNTIMKISTPDKLRLVAVFIGIIWLLPARSIAEPPAVSRDQWEWMLDVRLAALHGDRSQLSKLVAELQKPHTYDYVITLLQAVSRLGAIEALPAIDYVINNDNDPYVKPYDQVARARLLAENAAATQTDPQQKARIKIERFYQELNLMPDQINTQARSYQTDVAQKLREKYPQPLEVCAMATLADMVYWGSVSSGPTSQAAKLETQAGAASRVVAQSYLNLPGIAKVDFSLFPEDALKLRLASLSHADRIKTLVYELGHESLDAPIPLQDRVDLAKAQLLVDEGMAARPAIVAQLLEITQNHNDYFKRHEGYDYAALQRALSNISGEDFAYEEQQNHKISLTTASQARIVRMQILWDY
jgi:hypothetical protein